MMKKGAQRPLGSVLDTSMWRGQYKWSQRPEHGMSPHSVERGMPGIPPAMRNGSKPLYFPEENVTFENVTFEVYDPFTHKSTTTSSSTSVNKDAAIYSVAAPLTPQNPSIDRASLQRAQSEFAHLQSARSTQQRQQMREDTIHHLSEQLGMAVPPSASSSSPFSATEQPPLEVTKPTTLARAHPPTTVMDIKYQDVQPQSTTATSETTVTKRAPFSLGFDRAPVSEAEKKHAARMEHAKEARARGEETISSTQVDTTSTTRKVATEQPKKQVHVAKYSSFKKQHVQVPKAQSRGPIIKLRPDPARADKVRYDPPRTPVAASASQKSDTEKATKVETVITTETTTSKTAAEQAKAKAVMNVVVVPTQEDFGVLAAKPLRDPFPQDKLEAAFPETEEKKHIVKYIAPISAKEAPKPKQDADSARWYQKWLGFGGKAAPKGVNEAKAPAMVQKASVNVVVVPTQEDFGKLMAKPLRDLFSEDKLEAAFPEVEQKAHVAKYIASTGAKKAELPAPFAPHDERIHVAKYSSPKPKATIAKGQETETETLTTTKVVTTTETEVSKAEAKKAEAEPQVSTWRRMIFGKQQATKAAELKPKQKTAKAPEPVKKAATPPPKAATASAPKGTSPSQWKVTPGSSVPPKSPQAAGPGGMKPTQHTGRNILDELYGGPREKVPFQRPVEQKPKLAKAKGWEPVAGIHPITALGKGSQSAKTRTKTVVKTTKAVETTTDPLKKVTPHPRKDAEMGMPAVKDVSNVHAKPTDLSRRTVERMVSQVTKGQVPDTAVANLAPRAQKRDSRPLTYKAYEELKRSYDVLQKKRDTELAELRRLYSMLLTQNGAQQAGVAPEKYAGAKQRAEASESELLSAHDKFETFLQQHTRLEKEHTKLVTERAKLTEALVAAKATGEVSTGARDVEIRALRERIKELKEKSVNNADRVHVMPKVTILPKKQQPRPQQKPAPITISPQTPPSAQPATKSSDPQLKSLEAENRQLRLQLYQARTSQSRASSRPLNVQRTSRTPPPPAPAPAAAQPAQRPAPAQAADDHRVQVEALKARLSNTMEERDSALRKMRLAERTNGPSPAPVAAEESSVYLNRIRQLESRLNEQKPVLPKSAPIYAKQQPTAAVVAAPAVSPATADDSSVYVKRIRQLEKRLNEFKLPAQPKSAPVVLRPAPVAAAPVAASASPSEDSSVYVKRIRQLEKRLNEFEPVQPKSTPVVVRRAPTAADPTTENILTKRIRQLEHRLNAEKQSEKPRVVAPVHKASAPAAAAAPTSASSPQPQREVSELKRANEDLRSEVTFLKHNLADQTKSRSPLSVVRSIFGGKEQELTETEKSTLTQKTIHVEKTHDDPRVPKLESNVRNLSAENIRLKTEKAVIFEKLHRLESRQAQLPKGSVPAGAQPHKAQPAQAQQDGHLKRRVIELEHEKRALAEKHAKVMNDNRALNGELRHVQQETAKLAVAPVAQAPSPQAKEAMDSLRAEREHLRNENLKLQQALAKAREAPTKKAHIAVPQASQPAATSQAEEEEEEAAEASTTAYDAQVPELLKKIVALQNQLKDANKPVAQPVAQEPKAKEQKKRSGLLSWLPSSSSSKSEVADTTEAVTTTMASASSPAQHTELNRKLADLERENAALNDTVKAIRSESQTTTEKKSEEINKKISALQSEKAELAAANEAARAEKEKLQRALRQAQAQPVAPIVVKTTTAPARRESSPVVMAAPSQPSPEQQAAQQRIADLEREKKALAEQASRAEVEATKLSEALKAVESKPAPVLQAGNTDQLKEETQSLRTELAQLAKEKTKLKQLLEDAKVQNSRTRVETDSKIQSAYALAKQQRTQTKLLESELERLQSDLNSKQNKESELAEQSQQLLSDLEALLAQRKQNSTSTTGFQSKSISSGSSSDLSTETSSSSSDTSSSSSLRKSFAQRAAAVDPKYLDQVAWVVETQSHNEWEVSEPTNLDKDGPAKY